MFNVLCSFPFPDFYFFQKSILAHLLVLVTYTVHVYESLHCSGMEDFSFPYRREPYTWGLFCNKKSAGLGFFCL